MKTFFLFCSGADLSILEECPTEKGKYASIGAIVLMMAILAGVSGGYALFISFKSPWIAALCGLLWGTIIFNLERVIFSGMRKHATLRAGLINATPRLFIALLISLVISKPVELKVFEQEILEEIARINIVEPQLVDQELKELELRTINLRKEILAKQFGLEKATIDCIAEEKGTSGTLIPGQGAVFRTKSLRREEIRVQLETLEARNNPIIEKNEQKITGLIEKRQRQVAADGFLPQISAFEGLTASNPAIRYSSFFISLLFISLFTAPIIVKLLADLSPYSLYNQKMETAADQVYRTSSLPQPATRLSLLHATNASGRSLLQQLDRFPSWLAEGLGAAFGVVSALLLIQLAQPKLMVVGFLLLLGLAARVAWSGKPVLIEKPAPERGPAENAVIEDPVKVPEAGGAPPPDPARTGG